MRIAFYRPIRSPFNRGRVITGAEVKAILMESVGFGFGFGVLFYFILEAG